MCICIGIYRYTYHIFILQIRASVVQSSKLSQVDLHEGHNPKSWERMNIIRAIKTTMCINTLGQNYFFIGVITMIGWYAELYLLHADGHIFIVKFLSFLCYAL